MLIIILVGLFLFSILVMIGQLLGWIIGIGLVVKEKKQYKKSIENDINEEVNN